MCLLRLIRSLPKHLFSCRIVTFHSNDVARPFRERFDCPVYHWQLKNIRNLNALRIGMRLFKLVRKERIDIVHTFFQTADLWAAPIARFAGARVLISSRRDMGILRSPKHFLGYRLARRLFGQVHAVSEGVRQFTIARDHVDPERVVTIYNGIETSVEVSDDEARHLRKRLGIKPDAPVIICVANVRRIKGIDVLIRAAVRVRQHAPGARFIIVGNHHGIAAELAFMDEVARLKESLGVSDIIHFTGHTDKVDLLLKASDIFALPSRSEGLSNALLEAMRAGLPCVATAVGGNPEVVIDGATGLLVPPDDPDQLAESLLVLIRDSEMRRRMGSLGRNRIFQKFSVEAMASAVMAEYERLLEAKERRLATLCGDLS